MEKYLAAKHLHKISAGAIVNMRWCFELRILIYANLKINLKKNSNVDHKVPYSQFWSLCAIYLQYVFMCVCIFRMCRVHNSKWRAIIFWIEFKWVCQSFKNLIIKWAAVLLKHVMTFQCMLKCGQICVCKIMRLCWYTAVWCACVRVCIQRCQSVDEFARQSGSRSQSIEIHEATELLHRAGCHLTSFSGRWNDLPTTFFALFYIFYHFNVVAVAAAADGVDANA